MLPAERHQRILDALRADGIVKAEELVASFDVSTETIRRDLGQLEQLGLLTRVHGGAVDGPSLRGAEAPYAERIAISAEGKNRIADAAAGLLEPGQTVIIDVGTTALALARAIPRSFAGTVITPSLVAAAELADHPQIEVLTPPGRLRGGDLALSGASTVKYFESIHADVAFLGSGGIDAEAGLTDFWLDEAATRQVILTNSARHFVLAEHAKFDRIARFGVAPLAEIDTIITDAAPPASIQSVGAAGRLKIVVA